MKYLKWILMAILDILFNIVAYLTNPFVLLFADEVGNLPSIFLWWSNWDDHLDVDWMVYEHHVPKFAEYDFNKHYKYHSEWEAEELIGEHRGYVDMLDPDFTLWERFQRYVCRLAWLYRNCAYGFSYHVTGVDVAKAEIDKVVNEDKYKFFTAPNAFVLKYDRPSFGERHWEIFLGWKMQNVEADVERCMLAFRINPFVR